MLKKKIKQMCIFMIRELIFSKLHNQILSYNSTWWSHKIPSLYEWIWQKKRKRYRTQQFIWGLLHTGLPWPHYNSNSTTMYVSVPQKHKDWCPYNHIERLRYVYIHTQPHSARGFLEAWLDDTCERGNSVRKWLRIRFSFCRICH